MSKKNRGANTPPKTLADALAASSVADTAAPVEGQEAAEPEAVAEEPSEEVALEAPETPVEPTDEGEPTQEPADEEEAPVEAELPAPTEPAPEDVDPDFTEALGTLEANTTPIAIETMAAAGGLTLSENELAELNAAIIGDSIGEIIETPPVTITTDVPAQPKVLYLDLTRSDPLTAEELATLTLESAAGITIAPNDPPPEDEPAVVNEDDPHHDLNDYVAYYLDASVAVDLPTRWRAFCLHIPGMMQYMNMSPDMELVPRSYREQLAAELVVART